jgi:BirA family transcriptional regulator, biotin operon repressor / biotin---[acetyl-CoA-carboxylase] ligase
MSDDYTTAAAEFPDPFRLLVHETAASTNDELRTLAEGGAADGLVLLAMEQTAGRGRRGAAWFSAPGESLAFSILLRPKEPKALWPRLALAAGLSVAEAVESFGPATGIKWPNDVWIGRRKVAGILVEAGYDFAIVGIGINVNSTAFPAEVAEIATSLRLETGIEYSRREILAAVIRGFAQRSRQIGGDFDHLLDSIRQRCVLTGQRVSLGTSSGPRHGKVEGVAPGGELLLRTESGLERLMQADEVRIID